MEYRCSACHTPFAADEAPHRCPKCGVEAGLEPQHAVPVAMRLFGLLLACVVAASIIGGAVAMIAGA